MKQFDQTGYLEDLVKTAIANIRTLSDSTTIVGEPIVSPSGTSIIPVSKVSVGFVVGGGQYSSLYKNSQFPLAGGSGGGVSISPVGFIVETKKEIKFIDIEDKSTYQTILNLFNKLISKLNNDKEKDNEKENISL